MFNVLNFLLRYLRTASDLTRLIGKLEKDLHELKLSNAGKKKRIYDSKKLLKNRKDIIPQKDGEVRVVKEEMNEKKKKFDVFKGPSNELEREIDLLILELEEKNKYIEQVFKHFYTLFQVKSLSVNTMLYFTLVYNMYYARADRN